jgi:hypothetical protein
MAGTDLRDEPQAQYAVAKAEAMIEANRLSVKESFRALWTKVVASGVEDHHDRGRSRSRKHRALLIGKYST